MIEHLSPFPVAPSRVVILGGTGFIGTALRSRLEADHIAAIGLGSKDIDLTTPESVDLLVNLLRPDDVVVMLSCITPDRHRGIDAVMQNLLMGKHVHQALNTRRCPYMVYVSSDAVYSVNMDIIDETTLAEPNTLYGGMHIVREVLFTESNTVRCGIIRSSMAYGECNPHDMYGPGRFIAEAMQHGTISVNGSGEELRDHINVADLAELIVRMIMHQSVGKLIAATGQSISFLELARLIERLSDTPIKLLFMARPRAVFHRHFDIGDTLRAFPGMEFCTITEGLRRLWIKHLASCNVER